MRSRDERSFITLVRRALSPSVSGLARSASSRSYRRSTSSSLSIICRGGSTAPRPPPPPSGGPPDPGCRSGRARDALALAHAPAEEGEGMGEELLGAVLVGEELAPGNLHQAGRAGELRQHGPGLPHREERVLVPPDAQDRGPDAPVDLAQSVRLVEVDGPEQLEL